MLRPELLKYILDIESVIEELEVIIEINSRDYNQFMSPVGTVRA